MAKTTFSARWVDTVKPSETGQVDYFDTKPPNVGLRVASSGRKTWFIMYRSAGRLRRLTLGTYPPLSLADARSKATEAKYAVAQGEDPATQKSQNRTAPTIVDLAKEYIERHAKPNKRSWRNDERLLNHEILPHWGRRKAYDIKRRDVMALLDGIVDRGAPIQANKVLALVRKLFNWAISRDLLDYNPCIQVKLPGKVQHRDRVLSDEEIRLVWNAFEQLSPIPCAQFKMRLLTAQRGGEVEKMHWENLDLESRWWTIPGEFTKNGQSHEVPLSTAIMEILQTLKTDEASGWVFPSPKRRGRHWVDKEGPAARVRELSGVNFVLHDLRRTAASHMTRLGFSRLVVSKILNHAEPGITRVYDRYSYDAEKREALEAWGRKVMELVNRNP